MRMPWPLDLSSFFFRRKILRQSIPLLASFKVTYRCNLACKPCPFHLRPDASEAGMSKATAIAALYALHRAHCRMVVFEGGEPLLWRDGESRLHDLIIEAKRRFLRVAVTTNGTLPLDVPADIIWVSLDGLKPVHDELRGGSFDRVWSHLQTTRHPRVFVHCTLNRLNWRDIETLTDQIQSLKTVKGLTVQFFYPYQQGEADLALSAQERREVIHRLIALKKQGAPIVNSTGRLKAMIDNRWRCHDDLLINVDPDGTITRGCYVKSRGRIQCDACGFTPVAEAAGALDLRPGSLLAGWRLFLKTTG